MVEKDFSRWTLSGQPRPDTIVTYDTLTWVSTPDSLVLLFPDTSFKYLDLPLLLGKTWDNRTVVSTNEDITTPAGTFTGCVMITMPDSMWNSEVCFEYCQDVGLIRDYARYRQQTGSDLAFDTFFSLTGSYYLQ